MAPAPPAYLAIDVGAGSGRALVGRLHDDRLVVDTLSRFPNKPVHLHTGVFWDALGLYRDICESIARASQSGPLASVGVDTWGLDFALLRRGELLGLPRHYRDDITRGALEAILREVDARWLYTRTGIQLMPYNTLMQLWSADRRDRTRVREADSLVLMADLFHYWLTGVLISEVTLASTTQFLSLSGEPAWANDVLDRLGLPSRLLRPLVMPGTRLGKLSRPVAAATGAGSRTWVTAPASHDSASAVVGAATLDSDSLFISCGTWSIVGREILTPRLTEEAFTANVSNERGVNGTTRLLQNVMGLWVFDQCRLEWGHAGADLDLLLAEATAASPFAAFFDPDDPELFASGRMIRRVRRVATPPTTLTTRGIIARTILENVALKYRMVADQIGTVSGSRIRKVCMVGGGSQNKLLCQFTANAMNVPVEAGPSEASALGNLAVQLLAAGEVASIPQGREVIRQAFPPSEYLPTQTDAWSEAYENFRRHVTPSLSPRPW